MSFARCNSSNSSKPVILGSSQGQTRAVREKCPLASYTTGKVHDGRAILYRASKFDCDPCSLKPTCPPTRLAAISRDVHEAAREAPSSSRRQRKKVEMLFAHRLPSFPPVAREIKEAPREIGLAGLRAGSLNARRPLPMAIEVMGGGETLHHELPIGTVRVSDKKSVRVRRHRIGGIYLREP